MTSSSCFSVGLCAVVVSAAMSIFAPSVFCSCMLRTLYRMPKFATKQKGQMHRLVCRSLWGRFRYFQYVLPLKALLARSEIFQRPVPRAKK